MSCPRALLNPKSSSNSFQREVEAVARPYHPNIVLDHDAVEDPVGHFLVLEFVYGRDLACEIQ